MYGVYSVKDYFSGKTLSNGITTSFVNLILVSSYFGVRPIWCHLLLVPSSFGVIFL